MLSGGLDSSLLAGYLKKNGSNVVAVTEGIDTDNEMRTAKLIANTLDLKHVQFNVGFLGYRRCAELAVKWKHLEDGFAGGTFWNFYPFLRKISAKVITGFIGDGVLGSFNNWAYSKRTGSVSFEKYFNTVNSTAFKPETLRKLLKDEETRGLVSDVLRKINKVYTDYPGRDFQRIWCFSFDHRQRFHAGSGVWLLSFGAWPVLPYVDREILETVGGMPNEALVDRRLEKELFIRKLPELARLPLSSNTLDPSPLILTPWQRGAQQLYGDTGVWKFRFLNQARLALLLRLRGETRYWRRTSMGFDSPGWQEVRKMAEPKLELTSRLLDQKTVRELMPPPEASYLQTRLKMVNTKMTDVSSLKLLTGFALWLAKNEDVLSNASLADTSSSTSHKT